MSKQISLKQAERKVFQTAVNDGLWDLLIGSFVLMFAVGPLLSRSLGDFGATVIFVPFWLLVYVVISLFRKYVIRPRIGFVVFGPSRNRRLTRYLIVMVVANMVAFIAGTVSAFYFHVISDWIPMAIFGFTVLLISSFTAYFLNALRLFIYGLLFLLSFIVGEILYVNFNVPHHGFPITFGITAAIIIITGLVIFLRLLRENPVPVKDSLPEDQSG